MMTSVAYQFSSFPFCFIRVCIQKFPDCVVMKYKLTSTNTHWEATKRVMAAKLTRLTHKIAIQLHLVAERCIIRSSRSKRPVRKLFDTPAYVLSASRHRTRYYGASDYYQLYTMNSLYYIQAPSYVGVNSISWCMDSLYIYIYIYICPLFACFKNFLYSA
jgi:hypothetical protein